MDAWDPAFWRAGAISTTVVMFTILTFLTLDSYTAIRPGGSHVPPYTVINRHIDYQFNLAQNLYLPVIGGPEPLFGKTYTAAQATALMDRGKLVIQSRACMDCHTFFGNGAYYALDLTKAWLDPAWPHLWMPVTQSRSKEEAMVKFSMHPDRYANWTRQMLDLHIPREEALALVAYLKWISAVDANGFPYAFGHGENIP